MHPRGLWPVLVLAPLPKLPFNVLHVGPEKREQKVGKMENNGGGV